MRIMFENLPHVDTIARLVDAIYMCRENGYFDLEESLFSELILIFRSSEGLIAWSEPRV